MPKSVEICMSNKESYISTCVDAYGLDKTHVKIIWWAYIKLVYASKKNETQTKM